MIEIAAAIGECGGGDAFGELGFGVGLFQTGERGAGVLQPILQAGLRLLRGFLGRSGGGRGRLGKSGKLGGCGERALRGSLRTETEGEREGGKDENDG